MSPLQAHSLLQSVHVITAKALPLLPTAQAARPATAGSIWAPSSTDGASAAADGWGVPDAHQRHQQQPQQVGAPAPLAVLRTEHEVSSPQAVGHSVQPPGAVGQTLQPPHSQQPQPLPQMVYPQTQPQFVSAGYLAPFAGRVFDSQAGAFGLPSSGPQQHGFSPRNRTIDPQQHVLPPGTQGSWPNNLMGQQPGSPYVHPGLAQHSGFLNPTLAAHLHHHQQHNSSFGHGPLPAPQQQPQQDVFDQVLPPGWQPSRLPVPDVAGHSPPHDTGAGGQHAVPVPDGREHAHQLQPLHAADRSGSASSSGGQPAAALSGSVSGKLLLSMLLRDSSAGSAHSAASAPSVQTTPSAGVAPAVAEGGVSEPAFGKSADAPHAAYTAAAVAASSGRSGGRSSHVQQRGRGEPATRGAASRAGRRGGGQSRGRQDGSPAAARGGARHGGRGGAVDADNKVHGGSAPAARGGARNAGRQGGGSGRHAPKVVPMPSG